MLQADKEALARKGKSAVLPVDSIYFDIHCMNMYEQL